ncbi:dienelactone hydrolase family protein [Tunicatimonas pelagia]|uniref:dienelactone hydrolase family protein n=1 Tax=Tunicatimonas pelagia TaxID=931531 RepID=UPI002666B70E|nr:dienelactone hydrolase family protein [Tunicatimonas pelagia]WKN45161.1 dienelactone hydrolase family protein [Tunicatimonas pelagia]
MKYFSFFLLTILFTQTVWAQEGITVCGSSDAENTELFASLADDPTFRGKHDLVKYTHENARGEEITFATPDGQQGTAYYLEAKEESNQYLLVIHEWWGLNSHIKREADKLHKDLDNVHVMALDIYDGKVATTRELAQKYMQSVSTDRANAIINGAIGHAGENAEIATIGWCFGGGWSLQSTILANEQAIGCVMYYGMPVQDMAQIKEIETDVLGIFAEYDGYITPQVVEEFEQKMKEADKKITVHMYEADHGFANPSGSRYDEDAARDAYDKTLAFLKERL